MKRFLNWLALDHRSLGHQPLFWLAIFLPVTLFIVFGCISWIGSNPQWNYKGFNRFIEISKLPLGLLALALPFTALVTSWHRSIQTAKQIEETQVKNTADLYYAHLKFFIEQLEGNRLVLTPIQLHKRLYPKLTSVTYDTSIPTEEKKQIEATYNDLTKTIGLLENGQINHTKALSMTYVAIYENDLFAVAFLAILIKQIASTDEKKASEEFSKINIELEKINDLITM